MKRTNIWITAPAAAGKTIAINELARQLKPDQILTDAGEILALNKEDKKHAHHIHPNNDEAFLLTSSHHFDQAVKRIAEKLAAKRNEDSVTLIELARGIGSSGVDVSYGRLLTLIPPEVFARSIFIYIKSANSKRLQRNLRRKKENFAENIKEESFFVPQRAMQDFFAKDDFEVYRDQWPSPVFIVENEGVSLAEYKKCLRLLVSILVE